MSKEIWKPIKGYEGLYEVSNMGVVKSLDRKEKFMQWTRSRKGKTLKPLTTKDGYQRVGLLQLGKVKYFPIHRLLLSAFVGKPINSSTVCNHKNCIRNDNRLVNLEWVTPSQNVIHSFRMGHKVGIPHHMKPIIRSDGKIYTSIRSAARELKTHRQGIMNVLRGRRKSCLGYQWAYLKEETCLLKNS